jgi:hypothetical protein
MPRPGPRRPLVALRISAQGLAHIDQRAADEAEGVRSEMIRRMLAYAALHMPKGWMPK